MKTLENWQISVHGKTLAGSRVGEGPPIVLLHSLLADHTSFAHIITPLAQSHSVIVLQLPGVGQSDSVGSSIEAIADHIAACIQALALPSPPILLGNGYGGFVTLMTAIRHPQLACKLVLADCGASFSEPGRAAFRGMAKLATEQGLAAVATVAMRRLFGPQFQQDNPQLLEYRKTRFLETPIDTFCGACEALAQLDLRPLLKQVTLPVLVVVGEADEATPPPMSVELAEGLPHATLRTIPDCAHVPQLQAPEKFMDTIRDFI